jgi:hypothetical protein
MGVLGASAWSAVSATWWAAGHHEQHDRFGDDHAEGYRPVTRIQTPANYPGNKPGSGTGPVEQSVENRDLTGRHRDVQGQRATGGRQGEPGERTTIGFPHNQIGEGAAIAGSGRTTSLACWFSIRSTAVTACPNRSSNAVARSGCSPVGNVHAAGTQDRSVNGTRPIIR